MPNRWRYEPKITVLCPECHDRHYEEEVTFTNIYADMQERDVVAFDCPSCGKHVESNRFG